MAKKNLVSEKSIRDQFRGCEVPALEFSTPDGVKFEALSREFSTGSFGWNASGKINVTINGKKMVVSVSANFVVSGSKDM